MLEVIYLLFGLIVGSFLNVLIFRHNTGKSLVGRSGCMSCGSQLKWYELVPVLSWIAQFGKCSTCGVKISAQYPVVEIITATMFFVVAVSFGSIKSTILPLMIVSVLISISVYDIRHTIIPDPWVYYFIILSILFSLPALLHSSDIQSVTLYVLSGPILAMPFVLLWFVSKGAWMGLGDAKLVLGIGWLLNIYDGFIAVVLSFVVGAVFSVLFLILMPRVMQFFGINRLAQMSGGFTMKSEVPFGPFLVVTCMVVWFMQLNGWGFIIF